MLIRPLGLVDLDAFRALRLTGLQEAPHAFATSAEAWASASRERVERLVVGAPGQHAVWGVWLELDGPLLGIVGMSRDANPSLRHKSTLWGLYVRKDARRQGLGGALVRHALAVARDAWAVLQVRLVLATACGDALRLFTREGFERFGVEPRARQIAGRFHDQAFLLRVVRDRYEEPVSCPRCGAGMRGDPASLGKDPALSGFGRAETFRCGACEAAMRSTALSKFGLRRVRWDFIQGHGDLLDPTPEAHGQTAHLPRRVCPCCDGSIWPAMPVGDAIDRALRWSPGERALVEGTRLERSVHWSCLDCGELFLAVEEGPHTGLMEAVAWYHYAARGRVALASEPIMILSF